ncbi:MAG: NUDIX hydrolase [Dehalococcoidia bacterium]|nr:NUDIX hydrolase [Dehalococcoidia bacterium]
MGMPLEPWVTLTTELIVDNRWVRVRRDSARLPSGLLVPDYYYWDGGDFTQVFAVTTAGEVVLVRQYKYPPRQVTLELPAGSIDPEDADPLAGAKRELREETGYGGGDWRPLGALHTSPGKANTRSYAYLATGVTRLGDPQPDATEDIEVVKVPMPDILDHMTNGGGVDSNALAACLLALRALRLV